MDIFTADLHWNRSQGTKLRGIPHCAIAALEKSGIGEAFLNQEHERGILILHQTDLPSLQEVLDGEPWFGTKDLMPMVQLLLEHLQKHPAQRCFCFVTNES